MIASACAPDRVWVNVCAVVVRESDQEAGVDRADDPWRSSVVRVAAGPATSSNARTETTWLLLEAGSVSDARDAS